MLKRPVFDHNCPECIFLGRFLKHDLYVHPDDEIYARFGDEAPQLRHGYKKALLYGSFESNAEEDRILFEALKRSVSIGFFPPEKSKVTDQPDTIIKPIYHIISALNELSHNAVSETRGYIIAAVSVLSLIKEK